MKFNRILLLALAAPLLLSLAGCFRVDQELRHNADGSAAIKMDLGISNDFLEMMGQSEEPLPNPLQQWIDLKNDPAASEKFSRLETKEYDQDGLHHYTLDAEIKDISVLGDEKRSVADFKVEKLANGNYRYTQAIDLNTGNQVQSIDQTNANDLLKERYWTVRLYVPNVIAHDPRAQVDEEAGMVEWKMPMAKLVLAQEPTEMWVEYSLQEKQPGWVLPALIGGAVALVALVAGAGLLLKRRNSSRAG